MHLEGGRLNRFIPPYNGSVVHKPELQNHFYFENRFILNACNKRAIACKIALFVAKFALIVTWKRY